MNLLFSAAADLQRFFDERAWKFCFIGGLAVQRWGEPRLTQDVDVTLLTGFGSESDYVDPLLEKYSGRIQDARDFALRRRVLLLSDARNVPIDIALAAIPFEERVIARSSGWSVAGDLALRTCGAEDLIILKTVAGRNGDWADIEGIVARQGAHLGKELISRELEPLLELKEDPAAATRLRELMRRI